MNVKLLGMKGTNLLHYSSEPVIVHSLAFIEVGGPLLVNGRLYEVLSIKRYDE
ncbi:hypothetical protein [Escherichia phage HK2]